MVEKNTIKQKPIKGGSADFFDKKTNLLFFPVFIFQLLLKRKNMTGDRINEIMTEDKLNEDIYSRENTSPQNIPQTIVRNPPEQNPRPKKTMVHKMVEIMNRLSTLKAIKIIIYFIISVKTCAIIFNGFVIVKNFAVKETFNNLRLFLIIFTVTSFIQTGLFILLNKQYLTLGNLNSAEERTELGLMSNLLDAFLLFWCLTGYHWCLEVSSESESAKFLYRTCYVWCIYGIVCVTFPILALICLLVFISMFKAKLPVRKYKNCANRVEEEACNICLGEYEQEDKLTILPCNHRYHEACVNEWFNLDEMCPTCRKPINILAMIIEEDANMRDRI